MGYYARTVTRFPYVFIIVDIVLATVAGPITIWIHGVPDFSDPAKGFEPRGSEIKGWLNTAQFVLEHLRDGVLTPVPGVWPKNVSEEAKPEITVRLPGTEYKPQLPGSGVFDPLQNPRFVVTAKVKEANLFTSVLLRAICDLTRKYFDRHCMDNQCQALSLADMVAEVQNTTCQAITDEDVRVVESRIQDCSEFYVNRNYTPQCVLGNSCDDIPSKCMSYAMYRIVAEFTDVGFTESKPTKVVYSPIFLLWNDTNDALVDYYVSNIDSKNLANSKVKVTGIKVLMERNMFNWFVKRNMVWYGVAMVLVIIILVIYLRSPALMLTVILNVVFALSLSYWFYFMVCRFKFFPFINILAALLLIAVGADDLFIFHDIWKSEKRRTPSIDTEKLVSVVLHQGGISVFVTSFTTSAALLANLLNEVTAIRCFGAFSATCIMMNFVLFITWVPAILVILDRSSCTPACCKKADCSKCKEKGNTFWAKTMPKIVKKGAPAWLVLLTLMSVGSFLVVFWKPQLGLPSSAMVKTLDPSHPFEIYNAKYLDTFSFEKSQVSKITIQYMWGVEGFDNGDFLNAYDLGQLVYDERFTPYKNSTQELIGNICRTLLEKDFIDVEFKDTAVCYLDIYKTYLARPCFGPNSSCCSTNMTSDEAINEQCMIKFAREQFFFLNSTNYTSVVGQPLFDRNDDLKMIRAEIKTAFEWNANYENMKNVYDTLKVFTVQQESSDAVASGWYTGALLHEFRFYDLQRALASGTFSGISVSLAIGCVVLLLTTLNIFLTFYAILTITFVLATTAAVLALMGWELGASEALTLTLSMGLSIDFTLHLGVAYNLSPFASRADRCQHAIETVGSAISMAALTTLFAGAAMMLAEVWAYRQFGTFLVLTMVFSWVFALFFFMSLCAVIGPAGNIGNLRALCRHDKTKQSKPSKNNAKTDRIRQDIKTISNSETQKQYLPNGYKRKESKKSNSIDSDKLDSEFPVYFVENPSASQSNIFIMQSLEQPPMDQPSLSQGRSGSSPSNDADAASRGTSGGSSSIYMY